MSTSRIVAASIAIPVALALLSPGAAATRRHEIPPAGGHDGQDESTLVARANAGLGGDPSPEDVAAALEAAGASNVHVGDRVVGGVVGRVVGNDGAGGQAKDDAALTINERAIEELDTSPTADEVRLALIEAGATDVTVRVADGDDGSARAKLPTNAFAVSSMWADYTGTSGKKHIVFYGFWNFRNDYVAGGDPYDATAAQLAGFDADCWTKVSADVVVKDYRGEVHGHGVMRSDTQLKSVFAINDRTEDFVMLTDNGIHAIDMRRDDTGCDSRRAGSYFFEHNQDGGGAWSFSLGILFFSISYGDGGVDSLQRAAPLSYY
jgi:hypothetical protein